MLKKEFKRKDVERARNLIMGKTGASSETQVGYKKKRIDYKEGDVWKENGKTWTIKEGIKQTISKLDAIKKEINIPLCCPKCGKIMKHHLDINNYKVHKKCHSCVIKFEHKLKINGKYDSYIKKLKIKNNVTRLTEIEDFFLDIANQSNESYISEQGEVERWKGGLNKDNFKKDIKQAVKEVKNKLEKELTNEN
jgi:bacterioferritin-associated ferredoxin